MNPSASSLLLFFSAFILLGAFWTVSGCKSGVEESSEGFALATVTVFEVPDSTAADSITVHLAGTVGVSTAYHFDHIDTVRVDSLFSIAVWAKWSEIYGEPYPLTPPPFDTTLILRSPRKGIHYVDVQSFNSVLRDSTIVY